MFKTTKLTFKDYRKLRNNLLGRNVVKLNIFLIIEC